MGGLHIARALQPPLWLQGPTTPPLALSLLKTPPLCLSVMANRLLRCMPFGSPVPPFAPRPCLRPVQQMPKVSDMDKKLNALCALKRLKPTIEADDDLSAARLFTLPASMAAEQEEEGEGVEWEPFDEGVEYDVDGDEEADASEGETESSEGEEEEKDDREDGVRRELNVSIAIPHSAIEEHLRKLLGCMLALAPVSLK